MRFAEARQEKARQEKARCEFSANEQGAPRDPRTVPGRVRGATLQLRGAFDCRGRLDRQRMNAAFGGTSEQAIGDQREQ
jgi:hypothetical protein